MIVPRSRSTSRVCSRCASSNTLSGGSTWEGNTRGLFFDVHSRTSPALKSTADHCNTREFVDALVGLIEMRNHTSIVGTGYEYRAYHEPLADRVRELKELLGEPILPREISVPESQEFAAKSEIREFFRKRPAIPWFSSGGGSVR
jgi:hypothetical protein